jgi:hyaluronan synthase
MAVVDETELPTVSVVIPAFNEGALVQKSIRSVAQSDYPRHKLQVIAVDDGSSDDTWEHIRAAASGSPVKVITLRQMVNKGKRHALYAGFQKATGDVWVTVDSDSILEPDALRNGVAPLVRDERIGLVAGNVRVLNRNDSLITRFLKVSFTLSFAFSRAYQTRIRGLLTTPGALSLYRAKAVKPVLEKWMSQTFLGVPCLTGEDRSMTNFICAQGYHSFFQSTAVVWAKMPSTYSGMAKMFLRWARSNIRETVVLLSYLFKPFRTEYLWGFRINSVLIASTLVIPYFLIVHSYYLLLTNPFWLFRYSVMVAIMSIPMTAIYFRNERDSDLAWIVAYEFFWILACQWIMPYAFLTCRRQGAWITRGEAQKVKPAKQPVYAFKLKETHPHGQFETPGPLGEGVVNPWGYTGKTRLALQIGKVDAAIGNRLPMRRRGAEGIAFPSLIYQGANGGRHPHIPADSLGGSGSHVMRVHSHRVFNRFATDTKGIGFSQESSPGENSEEGSKIHNPRSYRAGQE